MNLNGIGGAIVKFFSTGIDVGTKAPVLKNFNLSSALSRVGNSQSNIVTTAPARSTSGVSGHTGGIVSQLSGVKPSISAPIIEPRSLTIPPMAMKVAGAVYNAKIGENSAMNLQAYTSSHSELNSIGERIKSAIGQSQENNEKTNQENNSNPLDGNTKNLPPIAQRLMAELAKHEAEKGRKESNSAIGQSQGDNEKASQESNSNPLDGNTKNLPPIAQRLMAELAKHETEKGRKEPISSDGAMGRQLRDMVDNFEKLRQASPASTLERTTGYNESDA